MAAMVLVGRLIAMVEEVVGRRRLREYLFLRRKRYGLWEWSRWDTKMFVIPGVLLTPSLIAACLAALSQWLQLISLAVIVIVSYTMLD